MKFYGNEDNSEIIIKSDLKRITFSNKCYSFQFRERAGSVNHPHPRPPQSQIFSGTTTHRRNGRRHPVPISERVFGGDVLVAADASVAVPVTVSLSVPTLVAVLLPIFVLVVVVVVLVVLVVAALSWRRRRRDGGLVFVVVAGTLFLWKQRNKISPRGMAPWIQHSPATQVAGVRWTRIIRLKLIKI